MKKEIGSIFALSNKVLNKAESEQVRFKGDRIYYSLCREAFSAIAKAVGGTVLLPSYTCQTVITPFKEAGWRYEFYSINKKLRIDTQSLLSAVEKHNPSLLVVHPFFGMDLDEEETNTLNCIKGNGIQIVLDLTQCLFSTKQYTFPSYIVASYRKWMPIPDGGYLKLTDKSVKILQPTSENTEFSERVIAAMYLRNIYFGNGELRTKAISIKLSKSADHIADTHIIPHKMSNIAYNLLQIEDVEMNQKKRYKNYTFLFHNICESNKVKRVCPYLTKVTTAPLYFPIYVQNRSELQGLLAQKAIYAPIIWPVEEERLLINAEVKYIYDHLLAIPCDQRYDMDDMQRVLSIINNY